MLDAFDGDTGTANTSLHFVVAARTIPSVTSRFQHGNPLTPISRSPTLTCSRFATLPPLTCVTCSVSSMRIPNNSIASSPESERVRGVSGTMPGLHWTSCARHMQQRPSRINICDRHCAHMPCAHVNATRSTHRKHTGHESCRIPFGTLLYQRKRENATYQTPRSRTTPHQNRTQTDVRHRLTVYGS
jgi:hypothetical protein